MIFFAQFRAIPRMDDLRFNLHSSMLFRTPQGCGQIPTMVHIYHHITKIAMPLLISNWLKQEPSAICPPWVDSSNGPNQVNWAHWHTKEINKN